jgi:hypothetical protein
MFIEQFKIDIKDLKYKNIKQHSYNLYINMGFILDVGHVILDKESQELIFRNVNVLEKKPYLQESEIIEYFTVNKSEFVLEYLIN